MYKKKLLITGIFATALIGTGLLTTLILKRNGIDLTAYIGVQQASGGSGEQAGTHSGTDAGGKDASGEETGPGTIDIDLPGEEATGEPTISMGATIGINTATAGAKVDAEGTTAVHEVKLPPGALDWSKPAKEPVVGDIVEFEILPGKNYQFKVVSVEIYNNPHKIIVHGKLLYRSGLVFMILLNGKLMLQIQDLDTPITYNMYSTEGSDKYIVQEMDPTKAIWSQPAPPTQEGD